MKFLLALLLGAASVPAFALDQFDNPDACPPGKVAVMGLCAYQPDSPPPARTMKPKPRAHHKASAPSSGEGHNPQ